MADESILHDILKYGLDPKKPHKKLNYKGELKNVNKVEVTSIVNDSTLEVKYDVQLLSTVDSINFDIKYDVEPVEQPVFTTTDHDVISDLVNADNQQLIDGNVFLNEFAECDKQTVTLDELHDKWVEKEAYRNALVKLDIDEKEVKVKKERKKRVKKQTAVK